MSGSIYTAIRVNIACKLLLNYFSFAAKHRICPQPEITETNCLWGIRKWYNFADICPKCITLRIWLIFSMLQPLVPFFAIYFRTRLVPQNSYMRIFRNTHFFFALSWGCFYLIAAFSNMANGSTLDQSIHPVINQPFFFTALNHKQIGQKGTLHNQN